MFLVRVWKLIWMRWCLFLILFERVGTWGILWKYVRWRVRRSTFRKWVLVSYTLDVNVCKSCMANAYSSDHDLLVSGSNHLIFRTCKTSSYITCGYTYLGVKSSCRFCSQFVGEFVFWVANIGWNPQKFLLFLILVWTSRKSIFLFYVTGTFCQTAFMAIHNIDIINHNKINIYIDFS